MKNLSSATITIVISLFMVISPSMLSANDEKKDDRKVEEKSNLSNNSSVNETSASVSIESVTFDYHKGKWWNNEIITNVTIHNKMAKKIYIGLQVYTQGTSFASLIAQPFFFKPGKTELLSIPSSISMASNFTLGLQAGLMKDDKLYQEDHRPPMLPIDSVIIYDENYAMKVVDNKIVPQKTDKQKK